MSWFAKFFISIGMAISSIFSGHTQSITSPSSNKISAVQTQTSSESGLSETINPVAVTVPSQSSDSGTKITSLKQPLTSQTASNYPTTSYAIYSASKQEQVAQSFNSANASVCSPDATEVDDLGLIKSASCAVLDPDPSINLPDPQTSTFNADATYYAMLKKSQTFTDADIAKATQFILKNSAYFGIDDINNFHLAPATDGNLYVEANQNVSGYSLNQISSSGVISEMLVEKNGRGIAIVGHFYPHASLPAAPKLSSQDIANLFVSKDYSYPSFPCIDDFQGTCHPSMLTVKLAPANLTTGLGGFLYNKNSSTAELRLAYFVTISVPYQNNPRIQNYIVTKVIDAMTGETLSGL